MVDQIELPQLLEITEDSTKGSRRDIAVWLPDHLEPPALMKMVLQFLSDRLALRTK